LINTVSGARSPKTIGDALETLEEIDLAVAYPGELDGQTVAVAAVLIRGEHGSVSPDALRAKIAALAPEERPDIVHIVDEIPMNTWFRPEINGLPGATDGPPERRLVLTTTDAEGPGSNAPPSLWPVH
jgi:putative long chain acyl-CoA synthase